MKTLFNPIPKSARTAILFFTFCMAMMQTTFGQNNIFSIDTFSLPPTGIMNSPDTAFVRIKNIGNAVYSGYLKIYFAIDSNNLFPFQTDSIPAVTIQPQGTFTVNSTIYFSPANFSTGSNIVVVWSSGNGKLAADSAKDTVTILPAGIHENDPMLSFSILPSLTHDFIQIHVNQPSLFKNKLQTLYITDVLGRPVYTEPFNGDAERRIPVDHLPPGLYFLELRYENKVSATQKFVRTN